MLHDGREEMAAHDLEKKSVEPLWAVFMNRATAEFTVLGILDARLQAAASSACSACSALCGRLQGAR